MLEVKPPRCPKCGERMRLVDGSDRTDRMGTWYVLRCPNCLFHMDGYKPRRHKK